MEYPAYQFKSLERYTQAQVGVFNRAAITLPESEKIGQILTAISETLLEYDICNWENLEIGLIVKPAASMTAPQFYTFPKPAVAIGRTNENDVPLKSPLVSKKHAEIVLRGTDYFLKDLRSNNGTLLNDVKINPATDVILKNDDVIKIDPFEIVVGLASGVVKKPLEIALQSVSPGVPLPAKDRIAVFCTIQPEQKPVAFLLDRTSATWIIRKIITGHKDSPDAHWTEIEEGLFQYLMIKILSRINPFLQGSSLLLDRIEKDEDAIESFLASEGARIDCVFSTKTEKGMVYGTLCVPESSLQTRSTTTTPRSFVEHVGWFGALSYTFALQLGASVLASDQIPLLEEGDIILLDRTSIAMTDQLPRGKMEMRCKRWPAGAVTATLSCDAAGNSSITVEAMIQEGMTRMADAKKNVETKQEASQSGEMLGGIEVPVTVEFARLEMTLEEIASFKAGQIIEFEKGQPEIVDLSVDGKIIANGKLVDVEGKLGVRILKIMKGR